MFKIAQVNDVHAGYSSGKHVNRQGVNIREADGYLTLSKIVSEIIEEKVNCVLMPGDTFHTPNPSMRTIIFVQNQLRRLWKAGIKVYMLTGNHDTTDIKEDISSSQILHDPWRGIYSHAEPYVHYEIADGIHIHMISHHMYEEQKETMSQVKPIDGEINILSTHGSCIDPILHEKLHTEQSPREVVIPDFLLNDYSWDYSLLGHIHERGWVGSKDKKNDTLGKKVYYNGSILRRGFADKDVPLGKGWTLWKIQNDGQFVCEPKTIAQRPQHDFEALDALNMTPSDMTEVIVKNIKNTQINGNVFDSKTAPILRQTINNLTFEKKMAIDWREIDNNLAHALIWKTRAPIMKPSQSAINVNNNENIDNDDNNTDVVKIYDSWKESSRVLQNVDKDLHDNVVEQARKFVQLGQEESLDEDE